MQSYKKLLLLEGSFYVKLKKGNEKAGC